MKKMAINKFIYFKIRILVYFYRKIAYNYIY